MIDYRYDTELLLHCVSKKVHPYEFHDNSVKGKPI